MKEYFWLKDCFNELPEGWNKSFFPKMCEEVDAEVHNWEPAAAAAFKVIQVKEKYGGLRFYTTCDSPGLQEIIRKYEAISEITCVNCGKEAKYLSRGWISPFCEDCAKEINSNLAAFVLI